MLGASAHGLRRTIQAEFLALRIYGFGHTVGVEDEAIIALERDGEVNSKPIKHATAVNSHNHPRRFDRSHSLRRPLVKQRRVVSSAREGNAIALMVQNEIGHADKHVFLNIRVKLTIHLS